jgi:hypothetical protein
MKWLKPKEKTMITVKDFKESLKAHNLRKEDSGYNENYNSMMKLGSYVGRGLIRCIMQHANGIMGYKKVSTKDAKQWALSRIESEEKPEYLDVITYLKGENNAR